jgi:hypothetical protein
MRTCFVCFALLTFGSVAPGAPAPLPRTWQAEAVLAGSGPASAKSLGARLASPAFLAQVLRSPKVRSLACLRGVKDPVAWLKARIQSDWRQQGVRIRLSCPSREVLTLLTVIVEQARGSDERRTTALLEEARILAAVRGGMQAQQAAQVEVLLQLYSAELRGPTVLQKPQLVRSGR